jgi:hypothetical protein
MKFGPFGGLDYLLVEGVGCVWLPAFMMAAPTRYSPLCCAFNG